MREVNTEVLSDRRVLYAFLLSLVPAVIVGYLIGRDMGDYGWGVGIGSIILVLSWGFLMTIFYGFQIRAIHK